MQPTLSHELKCYGRRNRAKPQARASEQNVLPQVEDARATRVEGSDAVRVEVDLSAQLEASQAGRGLSKKAYDKAGSAVEGTRIGSDVVQKQMPFTRGKPCGRPVDIGGGETARDASGKEEAILEGTPSKAPGNVAGKETLIVRILGPSSNGGQEQGRKKVAAKGGPGSRKTRAQLAKEEAQRTTAGGGDSTLENEEAAQARKMAALRRQALEKRQYEDSVLARADDIWAKQEFLDANKDKKVQPKGKEPARCKTHWDFVLEEMTWLAKDFERERKWKLSQAKKVALRVSKSKLDVESKGIRRQKEEEQRMRRVASSIAKEVKKFWMKVDKLVTYKQQLQIEETKKKALDKHLDFLLGQTERYSTMLAENLADTSIVPEPPSLLLLPAVPVDGRGSAAGGMGEPVSSVGPELISHSELETHFPFKDSTSSGMLRNKERVMTMGMEGGDEDFMLDDEEEQEDDEATLEADEALFTEDERREELGALQRESELPIEELRKLYERRGDILRHMSVREEAESPPNAQNKMECADLPDIEDEEEEEDETEGDEDSEKNEEDEEMDLGDLKENMTKNLEKDEVRATLTLTVLHASDHQESGLGSEVVLDDELLDLSRPLPAPVENPQARGGDSFAMSKSHAAEHVAAGIQVLVGKAQSDREGATVEPGREDAKTPVSGSIKLAEDVMGKVGEPSSKVEEPGKVYETESMTAWLEMKMEKSTSEDRGVAGGVSETEQPEKGQELGTLVVDLGGHPSEDEKEFSSEKRSGRREILLTTKRSALDVMREMQDDGDYIPAAMADGHDEDDDEGTLEEEERLVKEEGAGAVNEIDELKRESEMSLDELLAQYKYMTDMDDNEEHTEYSDYRVDDFPEDRRDRTSEAGTSGSSDEEDEDDADVAGDLAEAKERMGEPSTSGRDHSPLLSNRIGKGLQRKPFDSLDLKEEAVRGHDPAGNQKTDLQESRWSADGGRDKNGMIGDKTIGNGITGTSLLLQVDGEVDAETAAAVAKVTEAARRRGERIVMRTLKEERDVLLCSKSSVTEREETADRRGSDPFDVKGPLAPKPCESENRDVDLMLSLPMPGAPGVGNNDLKCELVSTNSEVGGSADTLMESRIEGLDKKLVTGSEPNPAGTSLLNHGSAEVQKLEDVEERTGEDRLADAAAAAQSAQPTGYTFSTTKVRTKLPFLLKHSLREYQHIGLDWLVTMYEKRLNGILADEMGLGKTIMTISLLAHLACEKGIWGPHLIVVPTSVMLNWETEFMKWCPAFKILTYFGSAKERKLKRQGWSRANSFHVCITTYRLVIQDAKAFKRKKWKYLILDEAHLIKNWKSQRWQTLLNFNSKRRILLTGTPLQNDLMELWSLMHFLMPHVFQSHQEFRDWFSNPITGMVEGQEQVNKELVDRLHNVLRPFLLRRLKKDVEKQLPGKFEHVIRCRLSKRQRNLYEDFMASSDTQATLASGNFLGLINVLMQLRKVCNHPDLFESRPIISSFDLPGIEVHLSSAACSAMTLDPFAGVDLRGLNLCFSQLECEMAKWEAEEVAVIASPAPMIVEIGSSGEDTWNQQQEKYKACGEVRGVMEEIQALLRAQRAKQRREKVLALSYLNDLRCSRGPVYGSDLRKLVEVEHAVHDVHKVKADPRRYLEFSSTIADVVQLPLTRCETMMNLIEAFVFAIPAARAPVPAAWCSHLAPSSSLLRPRLLEERRHEVSAMMVPLRPVVVRRQLFFPDRRLLQFDCGKLQELASLLRQLKSEGHRALIFTQMTKMLDVLESFINLYGYTYMRLDGSTKPEQRQILMQRFNTNPKIFLFILSTRSGGVGINLVGADTVIFYDSDWNPAMDQQAQDRCHRIGQTREVHIYRLVSESTIEENILKKANQKRVLDDLVIQSGSYNTEFFKKLDPMELFSGLKGVKVGVPADRGVIAAPLVAASTPDTSGAASVRNSEQKELSNAEVEAALKNAEDEADYMAMKRVEQEEAAENQEFTEEVFAGNIDDEDLGEEMEEGGRGPVTAGKAQNETAVLAGAYQGLEENGAGNGFEDVPLGRSSLFPADVEEDMDMLADVRQMAAAAAAAGRASTSFEDQLRPVERYAMRFLELWDPRVDKLAVVAQVIFEEKEWELDQLEKLKEEQEAEIDEDNEPLFYENWDTTFANEAYRQQVEVLAQQQENQRQLEWEAMEEEMRDADRAVAEAAASVLGAENFSLKHKSKKKLKKAKFKSLAEGSLITDMDESLLAEDFLPGIKSHNSKDPTYRDPHSDLSPLPFRSPSQRKRNAPKLLEEEMLAELHTKKMRKELAGKERMIGMEKGKGKKKPAESDFYRTLSGDPSEHSWGGAVMPPTGSGKNKTGGKISMMGIPPKKGPLVMLEKERKKDVAKSQDHVPPADPWTHAEDAVLCAVVHEYGGNWQLASETLAGVNEGGVYRGRHRHPVHCRERFRQLLAQNAAAASGDPSSEKSALNAATNAQLKVTEEHTKRLLDVVMQLPDDELLLQRHFVAVLSAWQGRRKTTGHSGSEKTGIPGSIYSPHGRPFMPLNVRPPVSNTPGAMKPDGKQPLTRIPEALAKVELDKKVTSSHSLPRQQSQQLKSPRGGSEDKTFSVVDFLVGSVNFSKSLDGVDSNVALPPTMPSPISLEDILGFSPVSPPPVPTSALRRLADTLNEQRFRVASKMGWDGATHEWAAAAGTGTGMIGVKVPSKGKGAAKKRPAPDPSKPPKPKQPRVPKPSNKKGVPGERKPSNFPPSQSSPIPAVKSKHSTGAQSQNGEVRVPSSSTSLEMAEQFAGPSKGTPPLSLSPTRPPTSARSGVDISTGSAAPLTAQAASEDLDSRQLTGLHQQPGIGDLAPVSLPQGQTLPMWSAGFPTANIPHGVLNHSLPHHSLSYMPTAQSPHVGQPQTRPNASASQSVRKPRWPWPSPSASPNEQLYNHQAFPSYSLPSFPAVTVSQEAASGPDLGLSLGSGMPKKPPGVSYPQHQRPHPSSS